MQFQCMYLKQCLDGVMTTHVVIRGLAPSLSLSFSLGCLFRSTREHFVSLQSVSGLLIPDFDWSLGNRESDTYTRNCEVAGA